jgi:pimeloyl-ACP methyl ester carboxylesterase
VEETTGRLKLEDGAELFYRLSRATERPAAALVLVHGLASNLTRWSEFVEHTSLTRSWDILRIDLRGHGESTLRSRLGTGIWCRDLLALLDREGYAEAVLVGHSLGAQIAVNFAHRYPSRARGLVLIDPILGRASRPVVRRGRSYSWLFRPAVVLIRALNRLGLRRRSIPPRDLRELDEQTRAKLLDSGRVEEMIRRYSSPWPDLKHFPVANYIEATIEMVSPLPPLSGIEAPVLVLLSKSGTYADPAVTRQAIGEFPRATTVAIDAHHWPLTERPGETRRAIEEWCRRQWPSAGAG